MEEKIAEQIIEKEIFIDEDIIIFQKVSPKVFMKLQKFHIKSNFV
jgi:hypothetical protein